MNIAIAIICWIVSFGAMADYHESKSPISGLVFFLFNLIALFAFSGWDLGS